MNCTELQHKSCRKVNGKFQACRNWLWPSLAFHLFHRRLHHPSIPFISFHHYFPSMHFSVLFFAVNTLFNGYLVRGETFYVATEGCPLSLFRNSLMQNILTCLIPTFILLFSFTRTFSVCTGLFRAYPFFQNCPVLPIYICILLPPFAQCDEKRFNVKQKSLIEQ